MKDFWNNLDTGPKILIGVVVAAIIVTIIIYTGVDTSIRGLND